MCSALTQVLEEFPFPIEADVEEPASTKWPDGRFNTVTLSAENFDFCGSIRALWVCNGYSSKNSV